MPTLEPLGDQGYLAAFENESAALRFARAVRAHRPAWLLDVVPAYASVAVFPDFSTVGREAIDQFLRRCLEPGPEEQPGEPGRLLVIPCCYELGLDLERIARHTGLAPEAIIRLHSETIYTVYAIGFCPGFPYLGYLPAALTGVPRLETPRVRVEPGSVGLTGRQTGIYTLPRPGGWNLIGRTPLELVHVEDGYFPLQTGDQVRFEPISRAEFEERQAGSVSDRRVKCLTRQV